MILRKIKDDPVLPRGDSSDVKTKMIELERKISHKRVMSIHEFFIDIDELDHLVYQVIHGMEVIVDASSEGGNGMGQFFVVALSVDGSATI